MEVNNVCLDDMERGMTYTQDFAKTYRKMKEYQEKIDKKIDKALRHPERGEPMSHNRKGLFEFYVDSYRLYYTYDIIKNLVTFIEFSHKNYQ